MADSSEPKEGCSKEDYTLLKGGSLFGVDALLENMESITQKVDLEGLFDCSFDVGGELDYSPSERWTSEEREESFHEFMSKLEGRADPNPASPPEPRDTQPAHKIDDETQSPTADLLPTSHLFRQYMEDFDFEEPKLG